MRRIRLIQNFYEPSDTAKVWEDYFNRLNHKRSKADGRDKKSKSEYLAMIAEASGMELEQVKRLVAEAYEKYKIGYIFYYNHKCWNKSEEEIKALLKHRRDKMEQKSAYIKKIAGASGLPEAEIEGMVQRAYSESGAWVKDFWLYRFWEVPEDEWSTYLTKGYVQKVILKKYNGGGDYTAITDKSRYNSIFSQFLHRKWTSNTGISFDEFSSAFNGIKKIIYKPVSQSCGRGIQVFDIDDASL